MAAFGASRESDGPDREHKVFMAARTTPTVLRWQRALAVFPNADSRKLRAPWTSSAKDRLSGWYRAIVKKNGVQAYVRSAGGEWPLMFIRKKFAIRDWLKHDCGHRAGGTVWVGMWLTAACCGLPYGGEQWNDFVQHTEGIDKHLAAFEEVAPRLAKAAGKRRAVRWRSGH